MILPPLRARREDIPPLIERLWRAQGDPASRCSGRCTPPTLATLADAHWPGNLDQLASVVSNLKLLRGDIGPEHAKRLIGETTAARGAGPVAPELTARFFELPLREAREAFERVYFEQLLGREQSNMSRVAEKAGLERTHLYRKLKQLNIRFARRGEEAPAGLTVGGRRRMSATRRHSAAHPSGMLMLGAIGVVFGDIGTSPLYTMREVFGGAHPIAADARRTSSACCRSSSGRW